MNIHVLRLGAHSAQAYAIGHADGEDYSALLDSVGLWAANLKSQGYDRIVSVLLAFQWSDVPWTRVDEAQAPKREAGAEVEAIFEAERLSRDPNLEERLRAGMVARVGPVALLEANALGSQTPPSIQARLFGQAMAVEQTLTPMERDLLCCMDNPVATTDLLAAAATGDIAEESVLASLTTLIRKGLVKGQL